ncbi:hypothetical protein BABINDRAFT_6689 [Babjeviella inositovora NRRL Y-12698]|uniref:Monothiol glutaredoxin-5, mitochondrial n=1 Tax=Babjeviella inositovora NRRL Y-12698 TaxID=984486 RepID=A0A1E3QYD0_9ASCO|nr:uncharacterized protein BABINDRAFT_6689 [Babjeviella inositovora NRRL Y-12698]ODQ82077.1 hypothetical protein BABINDRAFT_6689 [Babjeviella inositovora NRRL Y-12698]
MFRATLSRSSLIRPFASTVRPANVAFARFISDDTKHAIETAIASAKVVLFMKGTPESPQCGFSRATIQTLGAQGVDPAKFAAYNVLEDEELRQGIKEYSSWPTIPQLYVDNEFIGGCDIITSMNQSGELTELLEQSEALVDFEAEETEPEAPKAAENIKPAKRS